jgi:hypothetical protein
VCNSNTLSAEMYFPRWSTLPIIKGKCWRTSTQLLRQNVVLLATSTRLATPGPIAAELRAAGMADTNPGTANKEWNGGTNSCLSISPPS